MRIVSWNMDHQGHGRSHAEAWAVLLDLGPDIALVQEAVVPEGLDYQSAWMRAWDGKPWGSAILSRVGDLRPVWQDRSRGAVVVASCEVPQLGQLMIASLHARVIDRRVIPALRETFEVLRSKIEGRFVVGGDLNTARAAAKAWPRNGHGEFWTDVESWGFHDCYYLANGTERQSYWREWLQNKPPTAGNTLMDDHIFVDERTSAMIEACRIWDTKRVRDLSDHGPVVVDLRSTVP